MDTVIEAFGATQLVKVDNLYFLRDATGAGPPLIYLGNLVVEGMFGPEWTLIAAEQTPGGYQVVWKNSVADVYGAWNVDGGGNFVSVALGDTPGDSPVLRALEPVFHQDLNGDGIVGTLPSIAALSAGPTLAVDETALGVNASANFASAFSWSSGADGPATVTYALSVVNNGLTSLVDTATSANVMQVLNGGVVEGRTINTNALVFTLSVDAAGTVTLDQQRAVGHTNQNDPNDTRTLALASPVLLIATIMDNDGDSASAVLNIASNLTFLDDGPSIAAHSAGPTLAVDETALSINASADFASAFAWSSGADGLGTVVTYALSVVNNGLTSLVDTATSANVMQVLNGGVVEGRTINTNALVFTLSVDAAGTVTLDQQRAVGHTNQNDPNDTRTLALASPVLLIATIMDNDGDSASAVLNIASNLTFLDDGPSIAAHSAGPTLAVDETALSINASADFASAFAWSSGADGLGTVVTYALSVVTNTLSNLVDTVTNEAVALVRNGGVVEGRTVTTNLVVFTLSVNAAGTVTLDQLRAVGHANPGDPNDARPLVVANPVLLMATIMDNDGDSASAALDLGQNLVFRDDGPSITAVAPGPTLAVNETFLSINASADFSTAFSSSFGADGPGTVTYALSVVADSATNLIDSVTDEAVKVVLNGSVVEGRTETTNLVVFTVSVDAAGIVTLDQQRAIVNANLPNDAKWLAVANPLLLTATIVDKDGDSAVASVSIGQNLVFQDNGPFISALSAGPALVVSERFLNINASADFSTAFPFSFGADGPGTVTYALSVVADTSTNLVDSVTDEAVKLVLNGSVVEGRTVTSNSLVFTVSVDAAGIVTLDQQRAIVNEDIPHDARWLVAASPVRLTATIIDKDGDGASAAVNIGPNLAFQDDEPFISPLSAGPALVVSERFLNINASADFSTAFSFSSGADGPATINYALSVVANTSTNLVDTATNEAVTLVLNGGVVEGRTATSNSLVFTVSVNAAGIVTLDQVRAVVHASPNDPNEARTLVAANPVRLIATITDKDGDSVPTYINIGANLTFLDDGPIITAIAAGPVLAVDETALSINASADFASAFVSSFGADGPGTVTYALSVIANTSSNLVDTATNEAVKLVLNGGVVEGRTVTSHDLVFTVSVNAAGIVTLDQIRAVDPNDAPLVLANPVLLTATVTDKDGDSSSAFLNIGPNLAFLGDAPLTAVIEAFGATQLVEIGNQYFLRDGTGADLALMISGAPVVDGMYGPAWTLIGAEQTPGGYQVAWKNIVADVYVAWHVDGGGNFVSVALGDTPGSSPALQALEPAFHQDLNGDGIVGTLPVITALSTTATTLSFVATDADGDSLSLTSPFDAAFGTPAITSGATTTLTPGAQVSALAGTLKVSDGTNVVDVVGLYLGTGGNDIGTAPNAGLSNALYGFGGNDRLYGAAGNDALSGDDGIDQLDGHAGADAMTGGTGNDTYYVDDDGDAVTESAGEGIDTVRTTLSRYTLGADVERLVFAGSSNFVGTGNALANILTGGSGNDTLSGDDGNDTYYVNDVGDVVTEIAGAGIDTVRTTLSTRWAPKSSV